MMERGINMATKKKAKKSSKKRAKKDKLKITPERILMIVFVILFIVVSILGIKVFTMRDNGIDSVEADIVIPVIEENTNNTIQVDLSEMAIGGLQEYIFKISNYKGKKTAQEDLVYHLTFSKVDGVSLKLYKNDGEKDLLEDSEDLIVSDQKLQGRKQKTDLYRLIIKVDKEMEEKSSLAITISSKN